MRRLLGVSGRGLLKAGQALQGAGWSAAAAQVASISTVPMSRLEPDKFLDYDKLADKLKARAPTRGVTPVAQLPLTLLPLRTCAGVAPHLGARGRATAVCCALARADCAAPSEQADDAGGEGAGRRAERGATRCSGWGWAGRLS